MMTQVIIFFSILSVFTLWFFNKQRIRYWVELLHERGIKSTVHYDRCVKIFNTLYNGINATAISLKERRDKNIEDSTYTYGEVTFYSFVRMLEKADPKPGEIFCDLGSGAGKPVIIAGLVFDFAKAYGIEKLDNLYDLSLNILDKLHNLPERLEKLPHKSLNIEFIQDDILYYDWSDADIVYVSGTCFRSDMINALIAKFLKLKVGARLILGSMDLDEVGGFKLNYSNLHLMSWGLNTIKVYERI